MSSLVHYEPLVEKTMDVFLSQTERLFAETGKSCNFNQWLQFFAFDVIGDLTWSKRLGFVEKNEDVDGIIEFLGNFLSYAGPVCILFLFFTSHLLSKFPFFSFHFQSLTDIQIGQMPTLDLLLEKNPLRLLAQRLGLSKTVFPVTLFAQTRSAERASEISKIKLHGLDSSRTREGGGSIDLLSKFAQAAHDHPDFMTDTQVLTSCISMVFAGSETTAISLSSVFYFLLKHPRCYRKLMEELDVAVRDGIIEDRESKIVTWAETQKLPYLDAVIQESFRMHPAAGLILERIVPPQGMDILGNFVPGGTIVGCSPWVLHRRPEVFGQDVDSFRPERWMEAKPEQLKVMKATMFQFGAGARTCIGKNVSLLEVYKLVPSFLRRFEVSNQSRFDILGDGELIGKQIMLEHPDKEWKTHNAWFVRQLEFNTKFRPRTETLV